MNYNIDGVIDKFDIENLNIIEVIDVHKSILIDDYLNNNILDKEKIEILRGQISIKNLTVNKFENKSNCIYCIKFKYLVEINMSLNSIFNTINYEDILSYSFLYKDINYKYLNLKAINLDLDIVKNKLYININLVIFDILIENNLTQQNLNNIKKSVNKKNYSYIDTQQEFI